MERWLVFVSDDVKKMIFFLFFPSRSRHPTTFPPPLPPRRHHCSVLDERRGRDREGAFGGGLQSHVVTMNVQQADRARCGLVALLQ